jgi:hypothetical protein
VPFFLLQTRYLTPERHFQEWIGFLVVGAILVAVLGPKVAPKYAPSTTTTNSTATATATATATTTTTTSNALTPRLWMKGSSLLFYPYVAYTKLSWQGSNYPGRWLLFVGMPVGTLWILSALFCGSVISLNQNCGRDYLRYKVRYWLLETWISFLPLIIDLLPALFGGAVSSTWQYANGKAPRGGHDGENAEIAYFCHCLYLVLAPVYYFWNGELSSHTQTHNTHTSNNGRIWTTLAIVDCALKQVVGTSICAIYYMGIVTPAAIVAGLNVNFLLEGIGSGADGPNFRIYCVARWFCHGCAIRMFLGATKLTMETIQARLRRYGDGHRDIDIERGNNNKRQ